MNNPTLVIDLDGTLVDTRKDLIAVLNRTIAPYDIPALSEQEVGSVAGQGARAMIQLAFSTHAKQLPDQTLQTLYGRFIADYESNISSETVFYDGALEALDQLADRGWKLAICTNKLEYLAKRLLEEMGQSARFACITGSDTFEAKKPAALPLLKTVEAAGGTLKTAVMLGDTATDINTAKAAGIPSIAVSFGYSEVPVEELKPDHIIDHFSQLPALLEQYR